MPTCIFSQTFSELSSKEVARPCSSMFAAVDMQLFRFALSIWLLSMISEVTLKAILTRCATFDESSDETRWMAISSPLLRAPVVMEDKACLCLSRQSLADAATSACNHDMPLPYSTSHRITPTCRSFCILPFLLHSCPSTLAFDFAQPLGAN